MTRHKYQPPSGWDDDDVPRPVGDRESKSDRFKRVYNEQLEKPSSPRQRGVAHLAGKLFAALLVSTALLCVVGVMVWLVRWIGDMLQ